MIAILPLPWPSPAGVKQHSPPEVSRHWGRAQSSWEPGTQKGVQVIVADVEEARRELIQRDVQTSDVDVQPWGSFVTFSDP